MENNPNKQEQEFDVAAFAIFLLKKWYFIVVATIIAIAGVQVYIRYTIPLFESSSRIVINESREEDPIGQLFGNSQPWFRERLMIENDLEKLTSVEVTKLALKKIPYEVSYYNEGRIKAISEIVSDQYFVKIIEVEDAFRDKMFKIYFDQDGGYFEPVVHDQVQKLHLVRAIIGDSTYNGDLKIRFKRNRPTTYSGFKVLVKGNAGGGEHYIRINSLESQVKKYNARLKVDRVGNENSTIVSITFQNEMSERAVQFTNAVTDAFIDYNVQEKEATINNALAFIDKESERLKDSLDRIDKMLTSFRRDRKMLNLDKEAEFIFGEYKNLLDKKSEQQYKVNYIERVKTKILQDTSMETFELPSIVGIDDPNFNNTMQYLITTYTELTRRLLGAKPESPQYRIIAKDVEQQISNLQTSIKDLLAENRNQLAEINERLADVEMRIQEYPQIETMFSNLERSYRLNEQLYTLLLEKQIETGIQKASILSDHHILSEATDAKKIAPNTKKIFTLGIALGAGTPVLALFLLFYFDKKIRSLEHITQFTDKPFMGTLPKVDEYGPAFVFNYPKSKLAESLRSIKSNLSYTLAHDKSAVILVTSSESGEGKTFIAENLGAIYAYSSKKVCLIGADMRRPRLFADFGFRKHQGLSEYLAGQVGLSDVIFETGFDNLHIIPAGANPPNPAELLERKAFSKLLSTLREQFDVILIDSPPFGIVTDTSIIANHVDNVIYVMRHNMTSREAVGRLNNIDEIKLPKCGIVLNYYEHQKAYGPKYHYSSYGISYSSEYSSYSEKVVNAKKVGFMKKLFRK